MKKNIFIALVSLTAWGAFAQSPLEKGRWQLNAGLGTSGWGTPVYLGFDYGAHRDITIGIEGSYQSHDYGANYSSSILGLGVNGNYHFNRVLDIPSDWDLYAGLGVTYYNWNYSDKKYKDSNATDIGLGAQIGGRYFFTKRFGINLELGGGNATNGAKIGITYKL